MILRQETKEDIQPGFLMYMPVYKPNLPLDTVDERESAIFGYVYLPFRARNFMLSIDEVQGEAINVEVFDGTEVDTMDESHRLFVAEEQYGITNTAYKPTYVDIQQIRLGGTTWTVRYSSLPGFGAPFSPRVFPYAFGAVGFVMACLLALLIFNQGAHRRRALALAKDMTQHLAEARAKDSAMLMSIGDDLVVTDLKGNIVLVNKAFEESVGWTSEEVLGKSLYTVLPMLRESGKLMPDSQRLITQTLKSRTRTITRASETVLYQRKDGSVFPATITVNPIWVGSEMVGAVEVFRDSTDEQNLDRAQSEFISLAAHQLRTPLTSISWLTEAMEEKPSARKQNEYLGQIKVSVQRMARLVTDLLTISRTELGNITVTPKTVDLRLLLDSVMKEAQPFADQHRVPITFDRRPTKKVTSAVDEIILYEIVYNLLTNAIAYTDEKHPLVQVSLVPSKDGVDILVKDNGIGIPAEAGDQVFQKFFRAENAKRRSTAGAGLGLYLVHILAEASGVTVSYVSELNNGTTFTVSVPAKGMRTHAGRTPAL